MATYNGARFIEEQLASFVDQDRRPDELVVTDDGSTDQTLPIVERFAANASFAVRIERNLERLGYSRNFERAISLCTGDIILISDQDDAWYPAKIRRIIDAMDHAERPIITVNDQRIVDSDGNDSGMTMFGNFRRARCPDTDLIAGSCTALPRSLLPLLLPFPAELPYDSWIGSVADSLGIKRLIEEPLQIYRRHGSNATQPIVTAQVPTQWSAFRRYGMNDPRPGWHAEIAWRSELMLRLIGQSEAFDGLVGEQGVQSALDSNQRRISALHKRYAILHLPRWRRLPAVMRGWSTGFYDQFLGAKSALKDIFRP